MDFLCRPVHRSYPEKSLNSFLNASRIFPDMFKDFERLRGNQALKLRVL